MLTGIPTNDRAGVGKALFQAFGRKYSMWDCSFEDDGELGAVVCVHFAARLIPIERCQPCLRYDTI